MTAPEIWEKIRIDRPYLLATCGGITLGGGEPLLHPHLAGELRQIIDPELTIDMETSLNVPGENVRTAAEQVHQFMVDIKSADPQIYERYTGQGNARVFENLETLLSLKGSDAVTVRIPVIPGFTDEERQLQDREVLYRLGVRKFDLFRYIIPESGAKPS